MEIAVAGDNLGFIVGHAFHGVRPLARGFDRGFDRFGAGIHRQRHILASQFAGAREERPQGARVKGARHDIESCDLFLYDAWTRRGLAWP